MIGRVQLATLAAVTLCLALALGGKPIAAQQQQAPSRPTQAPRPSARTAAALDLTGYWVAVINEDWRWRMLTPPKGDYSGVPLTIEGRRVADAWDPARDEAAGLLCKPYGAAAIMRVPTRLHITWLDDNTLKVEADAGAQTRLLHFGESEPLPGEATWQGRSIAVWEGSGGEARRGGPGEPRDLKVVTTGLKAGYLRKNGVPYSEAATVTEYFDRFPKQPNGDEWMVVTAIVEDPKYLTERFITSSNFKKEADGSRWNPTPCTAR